MRRRAKALQASRSCLTKKSMLSFEPFSANRRRHFSEMRLRAQTAVFARHSSRPRELEQEWISVKSWKAVPCRSPW